MDLFIMKIVALQTQVMFCFYDLISKWLALRIGNISSAPLIFIDNLFL